MIESRADRWVLLAIVAGAIAIRVALMVPVVGRLDDPDNYLDLAQSLVEGRGLSLHNRLTAYRPPLYPIVLAPLVGSLSREALPWGIRGLHLTLGVGTVLLVHAAARRSGYSSTRALVAAAIVAFDPVLVGQSRVVMTETLATFLVAAILAALTWEGLRGAALGGFCFGLACLCRPSFLPCALLTGLAALVFGPGNLQARISRSIMLVSATMLTLLPWAQRNLAIFGEPVWTTTHGGYTLALANNWAYYQDVLDGPPGAVWGGINQSTWMFEVERQTSEMSEPEADRFLRSQAFRMLQNRPGDFARASVARLGRFWGLAPSGEIYGWWLRSITMAWTVPLWLALIAGLCRREIWRWPTIATPSLIIALTLVHLIYWTDMRMRAPLIPAIALTVGLPYLGRERTWFQRVEKRGSQASNRHSGQSRG